MRLVVLCRLVFLLPSWVPLPSPPPLGVPLKKTVYFVRPRYPRAPVSLLTCGVRCFPFFFFPYFPSFLLSFCGPLSVRPVRLLLPFSFPSVAPSLWEAGLSRGPGTTTEISARARPVLCKCREQDACVGKLRGDKGGGGVQGRLTSVSAERDVERPSLVRNMACPWADKRRSGTLPRHSRDRFGFCP